MLWIGLFVLLINCTNFTASKSKQAPPILIEVKALNTNVYQIKARAQNPEILFQGYRLYPGISERESRNPANLNSGIDCFGGLAEIPNQPFTYFFQISPEPGPPNDGAICRFVANLGPGTFITIRSLLLSLNVTLGGIVFEPSGPSNTLVLPTFTPTPEPNSESL